MGGAGGARAESGRSLPDINSRQRRDRKTTRNVESDRRTANDCSETAPQRPSAVTPIMAVSYVEAEKLKPTQFEEQYYDDYEYYNLTDRYALPGAARKGRTKKEARENTNKDSPCGHERKIVDKLQRTEAKKKSKTGKE